MSRKPETLTVLIAAAILVQAGTIGRLGADSSGQNLSEGTKQADMATGLSLEAS